MKKAISLTLVVLMVLALLPAASYGAGTYTVSVSQTSGGIVSVDAASAGGGQEVSGTVACDPGYDIATVRYEYNGSYGLATVSGNSFRFTMPEANVQVAAAFFSTSVWDGAVDISWYDPAAGEYRIGEPAELAGLAALVNGRTDADTPAWRIKGNPAYIESLPFEDVMLVGAGGGNVSDTVYSSKLDFAYKTVYLTADLDMGGRNSGGVWSGPNYTPVGGKFSMDTDMVEGDSYVIDTRFNGVFDGQGHTVSNIYCQRYASKGFPYSMAIGLIGFLGGESDVETVTGVFENGWQPAVKNVAVGKGYIYGRRMVGGVVGRIGETNNGVVVENCGNQAEVKNTDAKGVGGVVGAGWGKGMIRNCYNTGNVSTIFSCPAGGICGSNSGLDIYNCYNAGTINTNGAIRGRGIGGHDTGAYTVENCYYLTGCDDDPNSEGYYKGSSTKIQIDVKAMSQEQMKSSALIDKLNVNGLVFTADSGNLNGGYPLLYFQVGGAAAGASCNVAIQQSAGGTITADKSGSVPGGQVVALSAAVEGGYTLRHYTVNGQKIEGNFYLVTEDVTIGALFEKTRTAALQIASAAGQEITVTKTGYSAQAGAAGFVYDAPVESGDTLREGDILTVRAGALDGAQPADDNLEYTQTFAYTVTNAEQATVGSYTVTGTGDVSISAQRGTQEKSWASVADTDWYLAREAEFTLTTAAELAGLAYLVNVKGITFSGKTVKLGNDISLANNDGTAGSRIWKGIGTTSSKSFQGTFDGQGYSVVDMKAYNSGSYAGFFGYCVDAVICNLTVQGSSECQANTAYAAGLLSYGSGVVLRDCVSRVAVFTEGVNAGGIAAYICEGSQITGCRNYGSVEGNSGIGGIVGIVYTGTDVVSDSANFGPVQSSGSGSGTGGIAGKAAGRIENCANTGAVAGSDRYVGGIVGYANGKRSSAIQGSTNLGSVACSNGTASGALGGIVGHLQYGDLTENKNLGKVQAEAGFTSSYVGAIAGRVGAEAVSISGCSYLSSSCSWAAAKGDLEGAQADNTLVAAAADFGYEEALPVSGATSPVERNSLGVTPGNLSGDSSVSASGIYYLKWYSAGTLDVGSGLEVTLVGTGKEMGTLTIHAGAGAKLTLKDVSATGSKTLLVLEDGCQLTLAGKNSFVGTNDESDMQNPTVRINGAITIKGSGILYAQAEKGDAAVYVAPGSSLELASGIVSAYKTELLGAEGGGVYAKDATVKISGGALISRTSSDNVSALSAERFTLSSGSLNGLCDKSTHVVDVVSGTASGGLVRALGHSGNSDETDQYYYKESTVNGLSGAVRYYDETTYYNSVVASPQKITFNGEPLALEVYNIDGSNYFKLRDVAALTDRTGSTFSLDYNSKVLAMYATTGEPYEAAGGEMAPGSERAASCVASTWTLYVDGQLISCRVYNIGGNNYFKLRDLGSALNFNVSYDAVTNTAAIESN